VSDILQGAYWSSSSKEGYREIVNVSATAQEAVVPRPRFLGFFLTYALTVGSLAFAAHLWGRVGFDVLVVALGWPHVLLGLAFNLNRISRADLKSRLLFGSLLLTAAVIAIGHSQTPITTWIYLYFVFHAFRDEIYIYHERRTGFRFRGRIFDSSGRAVVIAIMALVIVSLAVPRDKAVQSAVDVVWCALAAILTGMAFIERPRRLFANRPGLRYAFPAAFLTLAAMTAMRLLRWHGWIAPLFFTYLVIFHYFSWYVFSLEKIAARIPALRSVEERRGSFFSWLSSRRGFLTAVVVLNVLSFTLTWSFQIVNLSGKLAYAFDLKYFLYFLVLHVTTSFVPKNSTPSNASTGGSREHKDNPSIPEEAFAAANTVRR